MAMQPSRSALRDGSRLAAQPRLRARKVLLRVAAVAHARARGAQQGVRQLLGTALVEAVQPGDLFAREEGNVEQRGAEGHGRRVPEAQEGAGSPRERRLRRLHEQVGLEADAEAALQVEAGLVRAAAGRPG